MMIGYLEVTHGGLILCDSQRTALSRRVIDLDTVSYCGITRYIKIIMSNCFPGKFLSFFEKLF